MMSTQSLEKGVVKKVFTLVGHTAGIECLAISPDGRLLASGDDVACVLVWNLATGELMQTITCPFNGAISAIVWVRLRDTKDPCFVFGCADGSLHLYRRKGLNTNFDFISVNCEGHPGPIEDLSFDAVHHRIASVGGGHPQVWKLSTQGVLTALIGTPPHSDATARAIAFYEGGCSVLVSYLETREISCYAIEPWSLKWTRTVGTRIGDSTFCNSEGSNMFITNLVDGIDQYKLPEFEKVKVFSHAIKSNYPLQVVTAYRGNWLLSGGDSGFARLFDRRTGRLLQQLDHGNASSRVQTVTAHDVGDSALLATGQSDSGHPHIVLWKMRKSRIALRDDDSSTLTRAPSLLSKERHQSGGFSLCDIVLLIAILCQFVFFFLILFAFLAYFHYRNHGGGDSVVGAWGRFVNKFASNSSQLHV